MIWRGAVRRRISYVGWVVRRIVRSTRIVVMLRRRRMTMVVVIGMMRVGTVHGRRGWWIRG
jgi:hypothetical protein